MHARSEMRIFLLILLQLSDCAKFAQISAPKILSEVSLVESLAFLLMTDVTFYCAMCGSLSLWEICAMVDSK